VSTDDVDTQPIVAPDAMVEHRSVLAEPGQSVEISIAPEEPMRDPLLFASTNPRDALVGIVRIMLGEDVVAQDPEPASHLRFGLVVRGVVSRDRPVKVFFENQDPRQVRIGSSLVMGKE
jgi:hypothetical protein